MFPLVLVWVAALVGPSVAYPVGMSDWSLANDLSYGDPWDAYHTPYSLDYRRGLIGNANFGGIRAAWPFDRSGTVLTSDGIDAYNPTVGGSEALFRQYDTYHGFPGLGDVADYNYNRGAVGGFTGVGGVGGVRVGADVGVVDDVVVQPNWLGKYYPNLRFGGVRGAWSDYYSNLGTGTTRPFTVRYGADQVYLKR